jgi:hypothetical protein
MIQFNHEYFISNSQGTIVFTEGKQGTINATYKISGKNDAGSINTELLNIVLNMVRPQSATQQSQVPVASTTHAAPAAATPGAATDVTCASFTNRRRSTIGF